MLEHIEKHTDGTPATIRLLLVDDDTLLLDILQLLFTLKGFSVTVAPSGKVALDLFQQKSFDVVVTDVRMPEMDGLSLYRAIRLENKQIPIIFVTGFSQEKIVPGQDDRLCEVLAKPLNNNQLASVIKHLSALSQASA